MISVSTQSQPVFVLKHPSLNMWVNVLGTSVFWCTVMSFPEYFLVNPLANSDGFLRAEGIVATIGWVLFGTVPLILTRTRGFSGMTHTILHVAILIWPTALIASHITQRIRYGHTDWEYLTHYPIFGFTVFVFPLLSIAFDAVDPEQPSHIRR